MNKFKIDLSSDTQTIPTEEMLHFMFNAKVGDEQKGEDPSVNTLLEMVKTLLGKEAALFLPSGTMCNSIAVRAQCAPGSKVILDKTAHMHFVESTGLAALCSVRTHPIDGRRGIFTVEQAQEAINSPNPYPPGSSLLVIEQTTNLGGGACWPLQTMQEVCELAHRHGLNTHLDGARLLNAVVAMGIPASKYAAPFDSVMIALTKGLGGPFGAVLAGSKTFIKKAWENKHLYGGAMRQAGYMAAAGIYALKHHVERLEEDHQNAKLLAFGLAEIPGIILNPVQVETNIVLFDVARIGLSAMEFVDRMRIEHGIRYFPVSETGTLVRAITHLHITAEDINMTLQATTQLVEQLDHVDKSQP